MKIGLPMAAVMTPTGSPPNTIRRATISQVISIRPPTTPDKMRIPLEEPTIILQMCGMTRPMNPMLPVKLTAMAVHPETMKKHMQRTNFALTPTVCAILSPAVIMVMYLESGIKEAANMTMAATRNGTFSYLIRAREPMFHS